MLIFDDTPLMLARGKYATLNAERRDLLEKLQILTGMQSSAGAKVLSGVQPKNDTDDFNVSDQMAIGRATWDDIGRCAMRLKELAKERNALRPIAWPRGK